ncbi:MAG TPA: winged helix-turn-helix transcriptional regulator [Solirubrobacterales bacterium]|nr:winged helix-turn-helix transcriptional regulator [Solirubrobacterales bacterium]
MPRREYDQSCGLACALDRIGERWSLLIVRELSLGPLRFSDLVRSVGGAPTDVLTKRLRDLEQHGIVQRQKLGPPATGIAYELTDLGRGLEHPMLELGRWGLHFERVDDVARLAPTSLANAFRVILQPPSDVALSVSLRSGGQAYGLRIEDGWIEASRGEAADAELTLSGEPRDLLAALVAGEDGEAGVEIDGDRAALDTLRAMVVLPERLREAALAMVTAEPAAA